MRAKSIKRNATKSRTSAPRHTSNGIYNPKVAPSHSSLAGRAQKLLGRAGAAQVRKGQQAGEEKSSRLAAGVKAPEGFVFEGHRASSKQGKSGLKLGGSKKKKKGAKPTTRSSKRGQAWKAAGGKKGGK